MKKLIRIIFLLLLVQWIFAQQSCTDACAARYICKEDPEDNRNCIEIEAWSTNSEVTKTDSYCRNLPVYDFATRTEKTGFICVLKSDGSGSEEKEVSTIIPTTIPKAIETTSLTKNPTLSEVVSTIISTTIPKAIETTSLTKNETTSIDTTENIITTTSKAEANQTTQQHKQHKQHK